MIKKFFLSVPLVLFFALPVIAQVSVDGRADVNVNVEARVSTGKAGEVKNFQAVREEVRADRAGAKEELKRERDEIQGNLKDTRKAAESELKENRERERDELKVLHSAGDKAAFEARRVEFEKELQLKRDEFKVRFEAQRNEAKTRIETKRAELKERLEKIKDEKKKAAVERIEHRLHELNTRLMRHFSAALDKIENVLNRIASRADKAATNGVDVGGVRIAILTAQTAIAAARSGVEVQASAVYEITFTDESDLRASVQAVRDQFKRDIEAVRALVKSAHEAVRKAATALAQIPRVDEFEVEVSVSADAAVNL
jgi:DNA repair exonuclease SbcCD ATPase subunit